MLCHPQQTKVTEKQVNYPNNQNNGGGPIRPYRKWDATKT